MNPESENIPAVVGRLQRHLVLAKLIGQEASFLAAIEKIPLVARVGSPVLILGETGTGKELCARAIHQLSPRGRSSFIPVDCGALPDTLVENELFGHVRGAFTDAHRDQRGLVGMAEGGTLFLDEIDSLAPSAQGKLLRLLQEGTYKPLGADQFLSADVRIVAATNVDLASLVKQKCFRTDLYFRLNVLRLTIPPLRERRGDIVLLARHFVGQVCDEANMPRKTLSPEAINVLQRGDWPGNVRELFNVIQSAVVFATEGTILPAHVSMLDDAGPRAVDEAGGFREARARALEVFERTYVEQLLREHNGNVTRSARAAKKDRRAFGRLIKRYQIDRRVS